MIRRLWRFGSLNRTDRGLVAEAAALLVLVKIGLQILRFYRLRRILDYYSRPHEDGPSLQYPVLRITQAIDRASRNLPLSVTCLVTALAADAMLKRRCLMSRLHLGVLDPSTRDGLQAHAWVESEDTIVCGEIDRLSEYVKLRPPVRHASAFLNDALCRLIRGEHVSWQSLGAGPSDVLQACTQEDLTGLIHERLSSARHDRDWPVEILESLAAMIRPEVSREALRRREILGMLDAVAAEGIAPILLKGAALAYSVYDAPTSRPRSDTDLLIRREDVEAVRHIMHARGYTSTPYCDGELLFCQFEMAKTDDLFVEHPFDFHWKISTQSTFADLLTYQELFDRVVPIPALGTHARGAGPVHALLLACIHPVMHHRNSARLIWIHDVHLLAARLSTADFEEFAELAIEKRVAAICAQQLRLAVAMFGGGTRAAPTIDALAAPRSREPSAAYLSAGRRWHDELISNVRSLPRWRDRVQLFREVLFPNPRYMLAAYGVGDSARSSALLPALYVHRAVRGAWKILVGRK